MYPMSRQWWRLGGVFGLIYIVLFIVGGVAVQGSSPSFSDSAEDVRQYFVDDGQTYLIGDYVLTIAFMLFFLPFLAVLRELLGLAEGSPHIWSRVAFAAGLITLIFGGAAGVFWSALAFGDFAETASDDTIMTLMTLDRVAFTVLGLTIGVFMVATSIVVATTGVLWKWLGYAGIVIGFAGIVSKLSILSVDEESALGIVAFVAFLGFAVWLLILCIGMIRLQQVPMSPAYRTLHEDRAGDTTA